MRHKGEVLSAAVRWGSCLRHKTLLWHAWVETY